MATASMDQTTPDGQTARAIAVRYAGPIASLRRFENGLCHFVYDVVDSRGRPFVLRIARHGNEPLLKGAAYWQTRLIAAGVPVARIQAADLTAEEFGFAYLILERLPGSDLGDQHERLTNDSKRRLGRRMAEIQQRVAALPRAGSYGEASSYETPGTAREWNAVIEATLSVCRSRTGGESALRATDVRQLERTAEDLHGALAAVEPTAFLDDTTTKNVIVSPDGTLSGIVDLDAIWFGDPLYALGLTRAAFIRQGFDSVYTDAWAEAARLTGEAVPRLEFYTALFAAVLLSEHGLRFNRDQVVRFAPAEIERLRRTVDPTAGSARLQP